MSDEKELTRDIAEKILRDNQTVGGQLYVDDFSQWPI